MLKRLSLALFCASLLPLSAHAASYDCTRADTAAEIAVCSNPSLNRMDEELAVEYRSLLNRLPPIMDHGRRCRTLHSGHNCADNPGRVFAAGIVVCHNHPVGQPLGNLAHQRSLAGIPVAAATKYAP